MPVDRKIPARLILTGCAVLATVALIVGLFTGSTTIEPARVLHYLFSNDGSIPDRIIDSIRMPRVLSAFAVGGLLALAGALMQVLLRNPLGDPYVLGISGGAASAVMGAMLLGIPTIWITPAAFGGALVSMLLVFALARQGRDWQPDRLLLTGIVLAAGWGALISFVLSISPPMQLPGMLFWLMGDLSDALTPWQPLTLLLFGIALALWLAPRLNIAVYGFAQAAALGVDVRVLRSWLYFLASLLTAGAVSIAGAIGFVGLITPHLVRLLGATDHRVLLPASALLGGTLLVLADTAARTVLSPMQLPVGVLTALFGVPLFLFLLRRDHPR